MRGLRDYLLYDLYLYLFTGKSYLMQENRIWDWEQNYKIHVMCDYDWAPLLEAGVLHKEGEGGTSPSPHEPSPQMETPAGKALFILL